MTDLTNAPAWVRETYDRANVAEGPWWVTPNGRHFRLTSTPWAEPSGVIFALQPLPALVAMDKIDVPRLVDAAAGMAEVLEESMPEDCYAGRAMKAADCAGCEVRDMCGRGKALAALAKYRGEVGK